MLLRASRSALACGVLLMAACLPAQAAAVNATPASAAIPLEHFFENPIYSNAKLSSDGRSLAVRATPLSGRMELVVVDLASQKVRRLASFEDADIGNFVWVNGKRLAFDVADRTRGAGEVHYGPGLYAINIDGSDMRQLVSRTNSLKAENGGRRPLLPWNTRLRQAVGDGSSNEVFVERIQWNTRREPFSDLQRLDTTTGHTVTVRGPLGTTGWLVDQRGEVRLAMATDESQQLYYYRDNAEQPWRKLAAFNLFGDNRNAFTPAFFDIKGNFYVYALENGANALYRYDLAKGALDGAALVATPGYDMEGGGLNSRDGLLGAQFETDAAGAAWFDPKMKAIQAEIDKLLPATNNLISVGWRSETPFVLVVSGSDVQPDAFLLYNSESKALVRLGSTYPNIVPAQMARKELVRYKARDGLEIPAWLTRPKGETKNLPLVVLVHGGPFVRGGRWEWERDAQFLASRGYVVLEPEFRGSTGYGEKHFRAGWKQWGLTMQDDIADGTRWAIAQGLADPKRICIAGASYGGYSTLMGLVNDPELYKCGINWVGVTDIDLLKNPSWSSDTDLSDAWKNYGMPVLIGDIDGQPEHFKKVSPLYQAARIKQPLLLAYGGADVRVPLAQGTRFYDAVKRHNPNVEWVVYDEEGHGWALKKNRVDFWGRVEKFLDRNIGRP